MKLIGVTLVHRHGARLPTKSIACNISWPRNKSFWSSYKGQLTPVGVKQAFNLGVEMKEHYEDFFMDAKSHEIGKMVLCNSSNVQRTINTAWSYYCGMFPGTKIHFKYMTGRPISFYNKVEARLNAEDKSLGIRINIEEVAGNDNLFHQNKRCPKLVKWQKRNLKKSIFLNQCTKDPKYIELADKIYRMTAFQGLNPENSEIDRMISLKDVSSDVYVSIVHDQNILANVYGMELTDEELDMLNSISTCFIQHKYVPYNGLRKNDRGHKTAGMLSNEIVRSFEQIVKGERGKTFHTFSAHDTSIVALAASFGITFKEIPRFLSYFLFELYEDGDNYIVKIYYNSDPVNKKVSELSPKKWENLDTYQHIEDADIGDWTYQDFRERFSTNEYLNIAKNLERLGNCDSQEIKIKHPITKNELDNYGKIFDYYDRNGDGVVDTDELNELIVRLEGTTSDVSMLIERFDTDGDGKVSKKDFIDRIHSMSSPRYPKSISLIPLDKSSEDLSPLSCDNTPRSKKKVRLISPKIAERHNAINRRRNSKS